MKKRIIYFALIVLSGVLFIYSCSKSYNSSAPYMPGGGTGATAAVSIKNMAFSPDTITVKTGTTVTWTNMDGVPHTVTEISELFNSGNLAAGSNYSYTFNTAGSFTYHCLIHAMMKNGLVVVTN